MVGSDLFFITMASIRSTWKNEGLMGNFSFSVAGKRVDGTQ